jgi:hypothetical protein
MAASRSKSRDARVETQQAPLPMTAPRRRVGSVERSIARTLRAATHLTDMDHTAVALLRSAARNVDACTANSERHTHALAVARMSELLTKLHLEPDARGGGDRAPDEWSRALKELTEAE